MQCRSCGTEIPQSAAYCPKCGAAISHQIVPEPERTSYGTNGPMMASSSSTGEQHLPSASYGSAPSAILSQEQHATGSSYMTSPQVPPSAVPVQNMTAPPPQPAGPPNDKRGFARSKGMIALFIGLIVLIVLGSVSVILYSSLGATHQQNVAATVITQTNDTATPQSPVTYQSVTGTVENFVMDLTQQNGGSTDNPRTLVWLQGSSTLYLFHANDFSDAAPSPINGDYNVGSQVTIVYQPDQTFTIDETVPGASPLHLQGTAYQVVQFTVLITNGQNPRVFTTKEYTP